MVDYWSIGHDQIWRKCYKNCHRCYTYVEQVESRTSAVYYIVSPGVMFMVSQGALWDTESIAPLPSGLESHYSPMAVCSSWCDCLELSSAETSLMLGWGVLLPLLVGGGLWVGMERAIGVIKP